MAQRKRTAKIDSSTARADLAVRKAPYWRAISHGRSIGYWKGKKGGTWLALCNLPDAHPQRRQAVLGSADDGLPADGLTVLNYSQALAKATTWFEEEVRRAKGLDIPLGPYTVAHACADYLLDFKARGKKSLETTEDAIRAHILPKLGKIQVAELTRPRIELWLRELASTPARLRTRAGLPQKYKNATDDPESLRRRKSTANRVLTILKAILNLAFDHDKVPNNRAWASVKAFVGVDAARVNHLEIPEQVRLVKVCPPDLGQLVRSALLTGGRYSELARFRVRDFNADTRTVFVEFSKSGKSRHIPLTEEGYGFFEALVSGRKRDEPLLLKTDGTPWGNKHHVRAIKQACKDADLKPAITFHELRHTYAVTLLRAQVPLPAVAKLLGHQDTRMVEKHYGHFTPDWAAKELREKVKTLGITGGEDLQPLVSQPT